MKLSKSLLILSSAGVGLSLLVGQGGNPNDAPTKAQQALRQRMVELNGGAAPSAAVSSPAATAAPVATTLPNKVELLTEVQRLHREGKITDQQAETFRKNISEQYAGPTGSINAETLTQAQPAVKAAPIEAKAPEKAAAPAPKPTLEPQAKAQAPQPQPKAPSAPVQKAAPAPQKPATPQPEKKAVAQNAPEQKPKVTEAKPVEKPVAVQPTSRAGTLTPELEAKARETLRSQIAAGAKQEKVEPVASTPSPDAQAKALAALRQHEAAAQPAPVPQPATRPAPAPVPAPKPEPVSDAEAQAKALAALRQQLATPQPAPQLATKAAPAATVVARSPAATPRPVAAPAAVTPAAVAPASPQQELEAKAGIQPGTPDLTKVLRAKVAEIQGTLPPAQAEQIIAPLVAPPSLPDSNKEGFERLTELTDLYKANRITPAQYHQERAKIVATLNK